MKKLLLWTIGDEIKKEMKKFSYFIVQKMGVGVTLSLYTKLNMFCIDMLWQGRGSESGSPYKWDCFIIRYIWNAMVIADIYSTHPLIGNWAFATRGGKSKKP